MYLSQIIKEAIDNGLLLQYKPNDVPYCMDCGEPAFAIKPFIKTQLAQWKAKKPDIEIPISEDEDTQPLSHAEIVYKQLEGRCIALMGGEKMTAGKLCDQKEFKAIHAWVKSQVGAVGADELLSDFFFTNNHLFT